MPNQRLALLALAAGAVMLAACDDAREIEAREGTSEETCSTCHGFPPPAPHPQVQTCNACHPQTVDADNRIIPGGAHANGQTDVSFGHPEGYTAVHSRDAIADIQSCTACHGQDYDGGIAGVSCNACHAALSPTISWQHNCTFCHGTRGAAYTLDALAPAAPPQGVRGETATSDPHVGAHQKHLGNGSVYSNGFACYTCHPLSGDLSHLDGQVEMKFDALPLASTGGVTPSFNKGTQTCTVYCHGSTLSGGATTQPDWTATLACNSCHGLPPATGLHQYHVETNGLGCAVCHAGYSATSVNKATHVNGVVEAGRNGVNIDGWRNPEDCDACHGAG